MQHYDLRRMAWLGVFVAACLGSTVEAARPTNVVFILTDNHGAWTLGCYGNPDIRTPNIDRLAAGGTRFTRAFASNAVCSPTRATYLTGLLPSQHGVHCFLGAERAQVGPGAYCTIREFTSLPKLLSSAGYACGLVGKWHLGGNMIPQEGFTTWVTMPHGATSTFYDAQVIEDARLRKEPKHLTEFWTDRAVQFIETNHERPFFLFLAYNGPYGLGPSQLETDRTRHAAEYATQELPSFPRLPMNPWLFNNKDYLNNPIAIRKFASELSAVDDGVGRVMQTLKQQGVDDSTLVVFCGDQGWLGGQHGIWGMGDHTRPLGAYDGMMQVPLIWRQPGRVRAGAVVDTLVSNYDFLPTIAEYLGLRLPNRKPRSPGSSYEPVLEGRRIAAPDEVFYEMENVRAIRTSAWKYVHRHPAGPDELYDLRVDPGEMNNLHGESSRAADERQLAERLKAFFDEYADPQYDLYRGGKSKSRLLVYPTVPALEPVGDRLPQQEARGRE